MVGEAINILWMFLNHRCITWDSMQKAFCLHNRMLGFKSKLFQVREKYICHIIFQPYLFDSNSHSIFQF